MKRHCLFKFSNSLNDFLSVILDYIYPPTCGMCNKISKDYLCTKCKNKINKELIEKIRVRYFKNVDFLKCMYLYKYDNDLRDIMLKYKFNEKNYLYNFFVNLILSNKKAYNFFEKCDIIIPVPMHYKKMRMRGYNQCELISKKIAENFEKLEYRNDILIKCKNNLMQSSLNQISREINVRDVYKIINFEKSLLELRNKKIILFDDIYTTGNTVKECVKVLNTLECKKICVFTIFKT